MLTPDTPEAMAAALADAAARRQSICLGGAFTKNGMAGPVPSAGVTLSTAALRRVLLYEPNDLTISVEAGLPWAEFTGVIAQHRQMVPLDPPFAASATVGGVLAANCSGPRRRLFGTARDFVIGMQFATLEGKIVQSGGMVVKNVAGLDMAKLLIGSFGTLAAIVVANFKLLPLPPVERHWVLAFDTAAAAGDAVRKIRQSVLQPASLDLLSPAAAKALGLDGWIVSVQAGGNAAVIDRHQRELDAIASTSLAPPGLLGRIQEFTPAFLRQTPNGVVVRASCLLAQVAELAAAWNVPAVARAGSGVVYACFADSRAAAEAVHGPWKAIMEFAPESEKPRLDLWPAPGNDFDIMKRVKELLDPQHLLNRGRLFRHL